MLEKRRRSPGETEQPLPQSRRGTSSGAPGRDRPVASQGRGPPRRGQDGPASRVCLRAPAGTRDSMHCVTLTEANVHSTLTPSKQKADAAVQVQASNGSSFRRPAGPGVQFLTVPGPGAPCRLQTPMVQRFAVSPWTVWGARELRFLALNSLSRQRSVRNRPLRTEWTQRKACVSGCGWQAGCLVA